MNITKVNIENYKCFEGKFSIDFQDGVNIIVGNNETGKSTILEAIHLALTGIVNGKYLRNEISPYLFNDNITKKYLKSLYEDNKKLEPPKITIEVFFSEDVDPKFEGSNNSDRIKDKGIVLKIEFDDLYKDSYEELLKTDNKLGAIPIEYYKTSWYSFALDPMISKSIPIKSVLIDSSSVRTQNSSDLYIARIIQNNLEEKEKVLLSQAYREMKESFGNDKSVIAINKKIQNDTRITQKNIKISTDLPSQSAWENALMPFINDVPFQQIGKGEQCIIKTNLTLSHKKNKEAALMLLEEPENHLTYTKMNELISSIEFYCSNKQIIITTHSSFIMNKLNIKNVILLSNFSILRLNNLSEQTYNYFRKLAGYPTLRLILCKKAVLVEGDSDELIFQKAYLIKNKKLPIQNGIDVLSVGLSFKRFLEIASKLDINTAVITDNDYDYENKILKKYEEYEKYSFIKIFFDKDNILNTLEPQFVKANIDNLKLLCETIEIDYNRYKTDNNICNYMINNKTEWALKVFESDNELKFPNYILQALDWCNEE